MGLCLQGITRRYDATRAAVSELDLDIREGELLVLVGPSGCGKSTILRLIAGLDSPDHGTISLDGKNLERTSPQDRNVAMVFQGYALYPHMTVREIMAFPLKMRRLPRAERDAQVESAAEMLGIQALLARRPHELSGGERQRVAMGRAIVRKPKLFLFDEPLSNLDAALRSQLRMDLTTLLRRLNITSIYVTHDQTEAMTMGDRIAVLDRGTLQQIGTPREIYENPGNLFVAQFLGTPSMNAVRLHREQGRFVAAGLRIPIPKGLASSDTIVVGIRPEHFILHKPPCPEAIQVAARIVGIEPLGAETFLYLDADGTGVRARTQGFEERSIGDVVHLYADPATLLWFEPEGRRLKLVSTAPTTSG